jgi:hypothetical protein
LYSKTVLSLDAHKKRSKRPILAFKTWKTKKKVEKNMNLNLEEIALWYAYSDVILRAKEILSNE